MSTEIPEPAAGEGGHEVVTNGSAHVDKAVIEVSQAELYMTPGARRAAHRLAWSLVVLFIVVIGIGAANLLFTTSQVHRVQHAQDQASRNSATLAQQVRADCAFYRDLSGLPLTNLPGTHHPSEVGVRIVSNSRLAWVQKSCPGQLPPPSPSFVAGARYYHLPVVPDGSGG